MLAPTGSQQSTAISPPRSAKTDSTASVSFHGSTIVSRAHASVTPGESGRPKVATPLPALASSASL
jgi:hypothetical protein